jgi:hypothetical protein
MSAQANVSMGLYWVFVLPHWPVPQALINFNTVYSSVTDLFYYMYNRAAEIIMATG